MGQDREVVTIHIEGLPIRRCKIIEHIISKRNYSTKDTDVVYILRTEVKNPILSPESILRDYLEREARLRTFDAINLGRQNAYVSEDITAATISNHQTRVIPSWIRSRLDGGLPF